MKIAAEKSGTNQEYCHFIQQGHHCRENVDFFAAGHGPIAGKRGGYEMDANGFHGDTFSG